MPDPDCTPSTHAADVLETCYGVHCFPNLESRMQLSCSDLSLPLRHVDSWFLNRRLQKRKRREHGVPEEVSAQSVSSTTSTTCQSDEDFDDVTAAAHKRVKPSNSDFHNVSPGSDGSPLVVPLQRELLPTLRPIAGHVRCLGWEHLPYGAHELSRAIGAALDELGVSWSLSNFRFSCTAPPSSDLSNERSSNPDAASELDFNMGCISVAISIFAAQEGGGSCHVDVRRLTGSALLLRGLYSAFRTALASRLNLESSIVLDSYSKSQQARLSHAPSVPREERSRVEDPSDR